MEKVKEQFLKNEKKTDIKQIIVYNDDVNTFDWVIQSLIEVCNHDMIQAEQCATLVHYKGKCGVKSGDYSELEPYCYELLNRQISAVIE